MRARGMGSDPLSRVSMLDGRSGAILHSMAVEDPATVAVDARAGRVLVLNHRNRPGSTMEDTPFAAAGSR